ncbi:hypothetical protein JI750_19255 [Flavobacterium sp. GN10]|uniref:Uncharacterized protein n=1 Tax=Flavobacterium tagetis TaxID=2801336 RepID=A0ABS1KLB3_9FLAO|nr:hypothetical protein [Flavobacterium tagetis]MBL0739041.1 hypothetical protein [Flavobacterium tagetis]
MHIEAYKTNVKTKKDASLLVAYLQFVISDCIINFDKQGRENILKIETNREIKEMVYSVFTKQGFHCQII